MPRGRSFVSHKPEQLRTFAEGFEMVLRESNLTNAASTSLSMIANAFSFLSASVAEFILGRRSAPTRELAMKPLD